MIKPNLEFDYVSYFESSGLKIFLEKYKLFSGDINTDKTVYPPNFSVNPNNKEPFPPEWDDLIRLHWLITTYKITTIMEFGIGFSSLIMAHALSLNYERHHHFVNENLRRNNAFELWSVDTDQKFIETSLVRIPKELKKFIHTVHSMVNMGTFQGRICTYYDQLPNICPDFIYLDGPDQFAGIVGDVRGVSTRHPDRLPMAADILAIEFFLLPGTIILVDGRTANARFLLKNLQRSWAYSYYPEKDISLFLLDEEPLGVYSSRHLEFMYRA